LRKIFVLSEYYHYLVKQRNMAVAFSYAYNLMLNKIMEQVTIFENAQFGRVRTSGTSEQPLFCLVDVCKVLEIENTRNVKNRLNPRYVHTVDVSTPIVSHGVNTGRTKQTKLTFINEPNLYRCIFQSRKKEAEAFQDWVFEEVLPAIRKTGQFSLEEKKQLVAEKKALLEEKAKLEDENAKLSESKSRMTDNLLEAHRKREAAERELNKARCGVNWNRYDMLSRGNERLSAENEALKKEITRMAKEKAVAEAKHEADEMLAVLRQDISEILRSCLADLKKGGQCNG
jgi:prophage antirepressor-like protein